MNHKTDDMLVQAITAFTSAYIVLAETLHEHGVLHRNTLAEALALISDRIGPELEGEVTRAILSGIQKALLTDLKPDLSRTPSWLRDALERKPGKREGD
jgi:hypothetical protein